MAISKKPELKMKLTFDDKKSVAELKKTSLKVESSARVHEQKLKEVKQKGQSKRRLQEQTHRDKLRRMRETSNQKALIQQKAFQTKSAASAKSWSAKMTSSLSTITKGFGLLIAAMALAKIKQTFADAIDWAGEMTTFADSVNISTEALSALSFMAEVTGAGAGKLQGVLTRIIQLQAEMVRLPTGRVALLFKKMGIDTSGSLELIVDGLLKTNDELTRADLLGGRMANTFGRLNTRIESMSDAMDRAREAGVILTKETAQKLDDLGKAMFEIGVQTKVIFSDMMAQNAEQIETAIKAVGKTLQEIDWVQIGTYISSLFIMLDALFDAVRVTLAITTFGVSEIIRAHFKLQKKQQNEWIKYQQEYWNLAAEEHEKELVRLEKEKEARDKLTKSIIDEAEKKIAQLPTRDPIFGQGHLLDEYFEKRRALWLKLENLDKRHYKSALSDLQRMVAAANALEEKEEEEEPKEKTFSEYYQKWIGVYNQAQMNINLLFDSGTQYYQNQLTMLQTTIQLENERWVVQSAALHKAGLENTTYYRNLRRDHEMTLAKNQKKELELKSQMFESDKKGDIANIWMDVAKGIASALAAWLPIPGMSWMAYVMSGLITAGGVAQTANVAGQQNPYKRQFGGWIPGMGFGDTIPVNVVGGEFVVNRNAARENAELLETINRGQQVGTSNSVTVVIQGNVLGEQDYVDNQIIPAIENALDRGYSFN